eukprot:TRINITY_DN148_c0_g3_i1.p1 TRINITY_DN148_c0_g3~~TRINITY_DN148_c0_g3_i1.p1  ORF type:complete len:470 (+),score=160.13 TRINITY_DN148_c0_g3_i1:268-1677(+)
MPGADGKEVRQKEKESREDRRKAEKERKEKLLEMLKREIEGISDRWRVTTYLSGGSYGEVCGAVDTMTNQKVAIKRVHKAKAGTEGSVTILNDAFLAKRVFREIKLLSHFNHENILGLISVMSQPEYPEPLEKLYMVMECMDTDLSQIIRDTSVNITNDHIQYFMFQIFHGLKCLHDAKVIHRDLHPGNILLNTENDIKICDFNLAKEDNEGQSSTDYVTYRWYRAPELVMQWQKYDKKIDLWSAGCIMCELFNRRPLFPGTTFYNQLNKIIEILGTPSEEDVGHIGSDSARQYLFRELRGIPAARWDRIIRTNQPNALNLISKLLVFSPDKRYDVEQALRHNFFKEPTCLFDEAEMECIPAVERFSFDDTLKTADEIKGALSQYILRVQERFSMQEATDPEISPTLSAHEAPCHRSKVANNSFCDDMSKKYFSRTNSDFVLEDMQQAEQEQFEEERREAERLHEQQYR